MGIYVDIMNTLASQKAAQKTPTSTAQPTPYGVSGSPYTGQIPFNQFFNSLRGYGAGAPSPNPRGLFGSSFGPQGLRFNAYLSSIIGDGPGYGANNMAPATAAPSGSGLFNQNIPNLQEYVDAGYFGANPNSGVLSLLQQTRQPIGYIDGLVLSNPAVQGRVLNQQYEDLMKRLYGSPDNQAQGGDA